MSEERNRFAGETSCDRCGWKYGFHICVDLSTPEPKFLFNGKRYIIQPQDRNTECSEETRAKLTEANLKRWRKERAKHKDRDQKMVERYREGAISVEGLGVQFGVTTHVARGVLARAEAAGEITVRLRGRTIAKGY